MAQVIVGDMCWRNCSCVGFKHYYDDETGCVFFHWNSTKGTNFASGGYKFYVLVNSTHHKGMFSIISQLLIASLQKIKNYFIDVNCIGCNSHNLHNQNI